MKNVTRLAAVVAVGLFSGVVSATDESVPLAHSTLGPEPFPDAWFFSEAKRPEKLKQLEGMPAKEINIAQWRGDSTTLSDLRGKVVVLDFWATWCGPCMAAIPKNVKMVDQFGDQIAFIGIHDSKNGWDRVDTVIQDKGINYPVGLDSSGASTKAYNLQFWPTYVVIDREGIVRGAGLKPSNVEEAVKLLLDEPYDGAPAGAKDAPKPSSFPDEWYYGGEKRPSSFRRVENKPMKPIKADEWIGKPLEAKAIARRITVVQFVSPELGFSLNKLKALLPIADKYAKQGVTFLVVCEANGDWEQMVGQAEELELTLAVARDSIPDTENPKSLSVAQTFGVRFGPATAIIDRAGVVRAVGLKTEFVEKAINKLLAEPMPALKQTKANEDG